MSRIAVIGSCNVDLTVEADRRPGAGETVMGKRLIISPAARARTRLSRRPVWEQTFGW